MNNKTNNNNLNPTNICNITPVTNAFPHTSSKDSIISKLQKMEEFYQNRTRILEDRITSLEAENSTLVRTNSDLESSNAIL